MKKVLVRLKTNGSYYTMCGKIKAGQIRSGKKIGKNIVLVYFKEFDLELTFLLATECEITGVLA